jgi:proteasome lid subunit RPN8/RPN11
MTAATTLPRGLINQLLQHAQQSPADGACGLIGVKQGMPEHCYPITVPATAAVPRKLFAMDPAQQTAALRAIRERGEELYAIYHSRPDAPPLPSPADLAECGYPEALYLIISLQTRGVLEMRGFRLEHGAVSETALEIAE